MTEYKIVPMRTDAEMDEKGYVHYTSWHETYEGLMPVEFLDNTTLEKCTEIAHRWNKNTLLLKINDETVGFSCYGESRDMQNANEVVAIYLLKEYQGRKLGYALMNATLELLTDKPKVMLWVLEGNEKAIKFYTRYGFKFDGESKITPFGMELRIVMDKGKY